MQDHQWWLEEQPQTVATPRNVICWFPDAGKLQLSRPDRDGGVGKTVTLDVGTVNRAGQGEHTRAILQQVMDALDGGLTQNVTEISTNLEDGAWGA